MKAKCNHIVIKKSPDMNRIRIYLPKGMGGDVITQAQNAGYKWNKNEGCWQGDHGFAAEKFAGELITRYNIKREPGDVGSVVPGVKGFSSIFTAYNGVYVRVCVFNPDVTTVQAVVDDAKKPRKEGEGWPFRPCVVLHSDGSVEHINL